LGLGDRQDFNRKAATAAAKADLIEHANQRLDEGRALTTDFIGETNLSSSAQHILAMFVKHVFRRPHNRLTFPDLLTSLE